MHTASSSWFITTSCCAVRLWSFKAIYKITYIHLWTAGLRRKIQWEDCEHIWFQKVLRPLLISSLKLKNILFGKNLQGWSDNNTKNMHLREWSLYKKEKLTFNLFRPHTTTAEHSLKMRFVVNSMFCPGYRKIQPKRGFLLIKSLI